MVRGITGTGEGSGPMIAFHTGFDGLSKWAGFLSGADRIVLGTIVICSVEHVDWTDDYIASR